MPSDGGSCVHMGYLCSRVVQSGSQEGLRGRFSSVTIHDLRFTTPILLELSTHVQGVAGDAAYKKIRERFTQGTAGDASYKDKTAGDTSYKISGDAL